MGPGLAPLPLPLPLPLPVRVADPAGVAVHAEPARTSREARTREVQDFPAGFVERFDGGTIEAVVGWDDGPSIGVATRSFGEGEWSTWFPITSFTVDAWYIDGLPAFGLILMGDGGMQGISVDPETGEDVRAGTYEAEVQDFPVGFVEPFDGGTIESIVGWEDGPSIGVATMSVGEIVDIRRVVARASGGWARSPVCLSSVGTFAAVALDDRVWHLGSSGPTLGWTELLPPD